MFSQIRTKRESQRVYSSLSERFKATKCIKIGRITEHHVVRLKDGFLPLRVQKLFAKLITLDRFFRSLF